MKNACIVNYTDNVSRGCSMFFYECLKDVSETSCVHSNHLYSKYVEMFLFYNYKEINWFKKSFVRYECLKDVSKSFCDHILIIKFIFVPYNKFCWFTRK